MDIPSDLIDRAGILIDDAQMHVLSLTYGIPGETGNAIRRGEGADPRVRLIVQLSGVLEQIRDAAVTPPLSVEEMVAANRKLLADRETPETQARTAKLLEVIAKLPDYSADMEQVPPMWALWLIDPSGGYGPHKPFAECGTTAEDAYASAIARYQPIEGSVTRDMTREPWLINPGHSVCRVCRGWNGDHNEDMHTAVE